MEAFWPAALGTCLRCRTCGMTRCMCEYGSQYRDSGYCRSVRVCDPDLWALGDLWLLERVTDAHTLGQLFGKRHEGGKFTL
jgi:hypothetical protein